MARMEHMHEAADEPASFEAGALPRRVGTEAECLEQILEAFPDVADRDDIHQAADGWPGCRMGSGRGRNGRGRPIFAVLRSRFLSEAAGRFITRLPPSRQ